MMLKRRYSGALMRLAVLLVFCGSMPAQSAAPATAADNPRLTPILDYIHNGWDTLTRSMTKCDSIADPKVAAPAILYLPSEVPILPQVKLLEQQCNVQVKHLPMVIERLGQVDPREIQPPGLLFLPKPYVVPGGRFNEMYGWDSYFIIVGLLRAGRVELARGIVDNFFYEIDHYGALLNANRTYMLTRSQPPFLSSMILGVYQADKAAGHDDKDWLAEAYQHAQRDYHLWDHEPHLAGDTGLARYYDFGEGPAQEGLQDETGFYRSVAQYFLEHPEQADEDLITLSKDKANPDATGFTFTLQICENALTMGQSDKCDAIKRLSLSRDYYKGDRSMRESGFDVSFRFGPFSAHTHDYAPIGLNSLLYKYAKDLEEMATILGHKEDASKWAKLAEERKQNIQKYLWNAKAGMFFDYDFKTGKQSDYKYITTFYPLWAGVATPAQAKALAGHLGDFEHPGGLAMSTTESGGQWDLPYEWAPTQYVAVEGLRRYGLKDDADRISEKFVSTVLENFQRDGTIREKYNSLTRSSESHVTAGYNINVVGFGWTNGVFLEFLNELPRGDVERLGAGGGPK